MELILIALLALGLIGMSLLRGAQTIVVFPWEQALVYVNGRFDRILPAGRYRLFKPFDKVDVFKERTGDQGYYSPPADVLSADRLPFRMSALVQHRVTDSRVLHERQPDTVLPQAVAGALVRLAETRRLEELVVRRGELELVLTDYVREALATYPEYEIVTVAINALTLPPELRRLFSEVEKARLESLAALERARGEQASLRALANAARMLKGNPELASLRLLQTAALSKGTTLVIGSDAMRGRTAGMPVAVDSEASTED